jgi:NADH-quinone oxidoreductase subunit N
MLPPLAQAAAAKAPTIDWGALSPLLALLAGAALVLLVGLLRGPGIRRVVVPGLALVVLAAAAGLCVWRWGQPRVVIEGALAVDDLTLAIAVLCIIGAAAGIVLSLRGRAPEQAGQGEYYAMLLTVVGGMLLLAGAQNLVTTFLGYELLSIPLYVLSATELRRATSLEAGLKYLVVGSVGSATLLYGFALIYGTTGATDYGAIARAISGAGILGDPLLLCGIGLTIVGLAFKASIAPFHQWTPDVYEGAPTGVTAFMAVATKAAAFGVFLRFMDLALVDAQLTWAPLLAALATISIVVGNVGAIGQSSLKRLLAWSSVAQAGYMLGGVVVASRAGIEALVLYLGMYLAMNLAAFAVVVARERESGLGDDIDGIAGLGFQRPLLAWPMTIAMLSLAGIPLTAGFIGKIALIQALVRGGYTWLGVVIVVGSMISLVYYLRVVAAMWMRTPVTVRPPEQRPAVAAPAARPAIAGGAPEADDVGDDGYPVAPSEEGAGAHSALGRRSAGVEVVGLAVLFAAASLVLGILPQPLFDAAQQAARAIGGIF